MAIKYLHLLTPGLLKSVAVLCFHLAMLLNLLQAVQFRFIVGNVDGYIYLRSRYIDGTPIEFIVVD